MRADFRAQHEGGRRRQHGPVRAALRRGEHQAAGRQDNGRFLYLYPAHARMSTRRAVWLWLPFLPHRLYAPDLARLAGVAQLQTMTCPLAGSQNVPPPCQQGRLVRACVGAMAFVARPSGNVERNP